MSSSSKKILAKGIDAIQNGYGKLPAIDNMETIDNNQVSLSFLKQYFLNCKAQTGAEDKDVVAYEMYVRMYVLVYFFLFSDVVEHIQATDLQNEGILFARIQEKMLAPVVQAGGFGFSKETLDPTSDNFKVLCSALTDFGLSYLTIQLRTPTLDQFTTFREKVAFPTISDYVLTVSEVWKEQHPAQVATEPAVVVANAAAPGANAAAAALGANAAAAVPGANAAAAVPGANAAAAAPGTNAAAAVPGANAAAAVPGANAAAAVPGANAASSSNAGSEHNTNVNSVLHEIVDNPAFQAKILGELDEKYGSENGEAHPENTAKIDAQYKALQKYVVSAEDTLEDLEKRRNAAASPANVAPAPANVAPAPANAAPAPANVAPAPANVAPAPANVAPVPANAAPVSVPVTAVNAPRAAEGPTGRRRPSTALANRIAMFNHGASAKGGKKQRRQTKKVRKNRERR